MRDLRNVVAAGIVFLLLVPMASARPETRTAASVATVPAGFSDILVDTVASPIGLAFTPDGRMLITTQPGVLRIHQAGALLPAPALDLSANVCAERERGLAGVAVDPAFEDNRFIYLYYTFKKFDSCPFNTPSAPVNRVSRFTLADDNTVDPATELVLIDGIPTPEGVHNGGDLHFGADGYLYVSTGDGGCDYAGDSGCYAQNDASRDPHALSGKILRITSTGGIPPTNPNTGADSSRCSPAGTTTPGLRCQETFASGLRNPFRFAFDPNSPDSRFFVNDVGESTWEEIDLGRAGADYGWNVREGFCARGSTTNCGAPPAAMTNPIYAYAHAGGCSAVTGAAFVPEGIWPAEYDGAYMYSDYVCGKIFALLPSDGGAYAATEFASGLGVGSAISMTFGPSGEGQALYYSSFANGGEVHRITYTGGSNQSPTAALTASPTSGSVPLAVAFDGSASSDPDSGDTVTYHWDFGDGTRQVTAAPTVSYTYTVEGTYTASLFLQDQDGAESPVVTLRIDAGNFAPVPAIRNPTESTRFAVGETITLRGSATDAEDGVLPDSSLTWEVVLHHDDHTHPFLQPRGGNDVPIVGPQPEDLAAAQTSYLEVFLTATDSRGAKTTTSRALQPKLVDVELGSDPDGVTLQVNATGVTTPTTVVSWEGYELSLVAPAEASRAGSPYPFERWADAVNSFTRTIVTPSSATSYTAIYAGTAATLSTFSTAVGEDDGDVEKGSSSYPPSPGATAYVGTGSSAVLVRRSKTPYRYQPVRVGLLRFDTSALPDDATITSATLRLHVSSKTNTDNRSLVAEWYPPASWPIDSADWTVTDSSSAHVGTPLANIAAGSQNSFSLQSLNAINVSGEAALRLHVSGSAAAPTGPNDLGFASFEDPSLPAPELVMAYTTPGA